MASAWYSVVVDCQDIKRESAFWAEALGYRVVFEADDEIAIAKDEETEPGLVFVPVPEGKTTKNRLHIDLNPDDQVAEVARLESPVRQARGHRTGRRQLGRDGGPRRE